jgi:YVTN family beta-propeller protein
LAVVLVATAGLAATWWSSRHKDDPPLFAYVASAGNNHVQVIDLTTGKTLRKIYTGTTPWRLIVSPDKKSLWVQHWYAGNTVVVELSDHEVRGSFPARGPGTFAPSGEEFLTFDWPASSYRRISVNDLKLLKEEASEIRQVYDVVPDPDGRRLLLAQFDPMAKGSRERYSYVLAYSPPEASSEPAPPLSYRTGQSPVRIRIVSRGDFVVTADRETNGLSLINKHGDTRSISTCQGPQELLISPDEKRMVVACSPADGSSKSRVVSYRTDFQARPWPEITKEASRDLEGTLVAGMFSPGGDRAFLTDRAHARLVEIEPKSLRQVRAFPTGDVPLDVVVLESSKAKRDRLTRDEGAPRARLRAILSQMKTRSGPAQELSWVETEQSGPTRSGEDANGEATAQNVPVAGSIEPSRRLKVSYRAPNSLRTESADGNVRLARDGHAVSIDADGRFWVSPRQDLIAALLSVSSSTVDEAIRQLAGDVPGSPYLRSGIAVDLLSEVEESGTRYVLIGALKPGERASQLWVDASNGRPTNLVEQFPTFAVSAHKVAGFGGIVETKFYDFVKTATGTELPTRLERVIDGRETRRIRIEKVEESPDPQPAKFDLARLGGLSPPQATGLAPAEAPDDARPNQPGRAVPILSAAYLRRAGERHVPYNSNPPTSGPRLPYLADWGIHKQPVPLELQVHNLEHGGIVIQYNCASDCADLVTRLERIAETRSFVIVAPYPWMSSRIALTAWGRIDTFDDLETARIERFIRAYAGKDHHSESQESLAAIGH